MNIPDPSWKPFDELMQRHVYHVLLVCSDYDRFLIEEDGRIEETLYEEYTQLGLSTPPLLTFARTGREAEALVSGGGFGLAVIMEDQDERSEELCRRLKARQADLPVIVLSPSAGRRRRQDARSLEGADYRFAWQGNPRIFLAMIKLIEDRMNLPHDTSVADVQVIILVEDSVRFASSYLPLMYTCLIDNNNSTILEALNDWGGHLRMRGRPKILLARTYEEAWDLYGRYRDHVLGVISDISFSRDGKEDRQAGFELGEAVRAGTPEIPIALQSSDAGRKAEALRRGFFFLWKQSPTLLSDLYGYMNREYGFGPFIFRDPDTGREIARAESTKDLQAILPTIDGKSFAWHSARNDFSRWLRAQGLFKLARLVHAIKLDGDPAETRDRVIRTIRDYRQVRSRRSLIQFDRTTFDDTIYFSRIGTGSLGGKGRALAFIDQELRESGLMETWKQAHLAIPRTVVLCTDLFRNFIESNHLSHAISQAEDDHAVDALLLSVPLDKETEEDLKAILAVWKAPLAVRSSSLLEDSLFQPFAGVYDTCMLSGRGDEESRLRELEDAVRCVWASTFHAKAKSYLQATEHMQEDEQMAVVIQPVTGSWWGRWYYPSASGVARSLDFWPAPGVAREDGVAQIAFGLGKTVVDGGTSLRFCPARPRLELPGPRQERFFALEDSPYRPLEEGAEHVRERNIGEAPAASLAGIASVWNGERSVEDLSERGIRSITFHGMLQYDVFPAAAIIRDLLTLGEEAMHTPVEIEFAIDLPSSTFTLLQIRPMTLGGEDGDVRVTPEERNRALIVSGSVIGNGALRGIRTIVALDRATFERGKMAEMAGELETINRSLHGAPYLLLAVGRIGSSDPWLGIPVSWSQISSCQVLVELETPNLPVEPSQGTHFFQNLTSLGAVALTTAPGLWHEDRIPPEFLAGRTAHFKIWRFPDDLTVKVDGRRNEAVVCIGP